jgi:hypothetical protein
MPVHRGSNKYGYYYQWGNHGKKYYYVPNNVKSRNLSYALATIQGRAAYAHGYKGH